MPNSERVLPLARQRQLTQMEFRPPQIEGLKHFNFPVQKPTMNINEQPNIKSLQNMFHGNLPQNRTANWFYNWNFLLYNKSTSWKIIVHHQTSQEADWKPTKSKSTKAPTQCKTSSICSSDPPGLCTIQIYWNWISDSSIIFHIMCIWYLSRCPCISPNKSRSDILFYTCMETVLRAMRAICISPSCHLELAWQHSTSMAAETENNLSISV